MANQKTSFSLEGKDIQSTPNPCTEDIYTEDVLETFAKSATDNAANNNESFAISMNNSVYTRIIWATAPTYHKHSFWEICFAIKGKGIQHFPNRTEPVMPGSIWILRPDDVHYVETIGDTRSIATSVYAHRDIYISKQKMQRIADALEEGLYERLLNAPEPLSTVLPPVYTTQLESILNHYSATERDFEFMHSVIVSHILCCVLEQKKSLKKEYPKWLNSLILNLNREEFMIKPMDEIISSTGYSQSYVCRQFRRYMNTTLVQYIREKKCTYSLALLNNLDIPIIDIAYRLRFADESAYINIFKDFYHMTPGQWRKKIKSAAIPPRL